MFYCRSHSLDDKDFYILIRRFNMSVNIDVDLGGILSRKACAIIIKHIIKFVAYNNQQIPYTYEGIQKLVTRKRRNSEKPQETFSQRPLTFKQIKANNFYDKIENIYDAFETTFMCVEEELVEGNVFKEIAIVLGATLVSPKHIYRIRIPELSPNEDCDSRVRSHLFKIYRSIISSNGTNQFSGNGSGLTNIFILINGECKSAVGRDWFIPKFDFRIARSVSQTTISFIDPTVGNECDCKETEGASVSSGVIRNSRIDSTDGPSSASVLDHRSEEIPEKSKWYLARQALSGFQDLKIDGVSVFNELVYQDS